MPLTADFIKEMQHQRARIHLVTTKLYKLSMSFSDVGNANLSLTLWKYYELLKSIDETLGAIVDGQMEADQATTQKMAYETAKFITALIDRGLSEVDLP